MTKQYATFLENYFKGFETIKELYLEALRAPTDAVNLKRDPYLREKFLKKRFGRTREERIESMKYYDQAHLLRKQKYDQDLEDAAKAQEVEQTKRLEHAKNRRSLGFIDFHSDANGNLMPLEDGQGVDDQVMDELNIKDARYQKKVQDIRSRKKVEIVTPVAGISKEEYRKGMLRSDEFFKDV